MMESAPPIPQHFPFTKLPLDIQYSICQSLCGHCGNNDPISILYHNPREQTRALQNLSLTNRSMCSLAQRILYHLPRIYHYTKFFRTIQARPDLAVCVKVQRWIVMDDDRRSQDRGEDLEYLRKLAAKLGLEDTEAAEFAKRYEDYPYGHESDVHGNGRYAFTIDFDNFMTAIILALCPRLEFLAINLDDARYEIRDWDPNPARYRYLPGLVKPDGFPFLHTLVLLNTLHHDPNTLGIDRVSFIWPLFPNVSRLIFFRGESEDHFHTNILVPEDEPRPECSWKALPRLKELRFLRYSRRQRELPFPAIQRLVNRCQGLEKFVFSPLELTGQVFAPASLLQTISSTTSTLRHLTINCPIPEDTSVDTHQLIGSSLKQFTQLESLILDQAVFCHHHHDLTSTSGPECLTAILPEGIRHLTINMHATFAPIMDIMALGNCVALQGRYRKLAHLRVQMTFEEEYWMEVDPPTTPNKYLQPHSWIPHKERPPEINRPLLELRHRLREQIMGAFQGTSVAIETDFYRPYYYSQDRPLMEPAPAFWSDVKLIDADDSDFSICK